MSKRSRSESPASRVATTKRSIMSNRSRSRLPVSRVATPVSRVATTIIPIGGVDITLSKNLESLTEGQLVAAATTAISRLKPEKGPDGLVIITSFSHTAIIADIQGATDDTITQKRRIIETLASGGIVLSEPESQGVSLKNVACFALPANLNLNKLNIAGVGAKSFVSPEFIKQIVDIIIRNLSSNITNIIVDIKNILEPLFIGEAKKVFKPYTDYRFNAIDKLVKSELKKASKRNPNVLTFQHLSNAAQNRVADQTHYEPLVNAIAYQFHYDNLHSGEAFQTFQPFQPGSCMMNKVYMRQDKIAEHIPSPTVPWDWQMNAFGKNGAQLIGNMPSAVDNSWKMDLITIVKILKKTDMVTTKDILDLLYENEIRNIVFIDGGCNVFCGDGGMLACSGCHPSLDIICDTCQTSLRNHLRGGMKNKKIKKTTKKKATVRGRRMRKSYKRYKRSKTYKRYTF